MDLATRYGYVTARKLLPRIQVVRSINTLAPIGIPSN